MASSHSLLVQLSRPLINSRQLEVRLVDTNGGVNSQRKFEFAPPLRESRDELHESTFPDRTRENLDENLLSIGGISLSKRQIIIPTNFR